MSCPRFQVFIELVEVYYSTAIEEGIILCYWGGGGGGGGTVFGGYVPQVEFVYPVFARMPGESYRRRLGPLLLYLCDVFRALINSLVC